MEALITIPAIKEALEFLKQDDERTLKEQLELIHCITGIKQATNSRSGFLQSKKSRDFQKRHAVSLK